MSLSARRAWIEIICFGSLAGPSGVALRKESVDRNCYAVFCRFGGTRSLSARRAWIEILDTLVTTHADLVALRKESVDRNTDGYELIYWSYVALRKESVDRNTYGRCVLRIVSVSLSARRAWIEIYAWSIPSTPSSSLSARRAWIEICARNTADRLSCVALRKESVDRNCSFPDSNDPFTVTSLSARRAWIEMSFCRRLLFPCVSLSARRAWIEIVVAAARFCRAAVALRKESVDRNRVWRRANYGVFGRSPQGERG